MGIHCVCIQVCYFITIDSYYICSFPYVDTDISVTFIDLFDRV